MMVSNNRGIVLLITLFFITAISILILQNLKDSEGFFKVVNTNVSLTQTQITVKNVNDEIMLFFKTKKDDIDDILTKLPPFLPFVLTKDINIKINLTEYFPEDYINLDDINQSATTERFDSNIDYRYRFFEILNRDKKLLKNKKFTNRKQINSIIDEYIQYTKDTRILEIKDEFTYGDFDNNDSARYLSCNYEVDISNMKSIVDMVFKVGEEKPLHFEFSFMNK